MPHIPNLLTSGTLLDSVDYLTASTCCIVLEFLYRTDDLISGVWEIYLKRSLGHGSALKIVYFPEKRVTLQVRAVSRNLSNDCIDLRVGFGSWSRKVQKTLQKNNFNATFHHEKC